MEKDLKTTINNTESKEVSVENYISNKFNRLKKPLAILTIAAALGGGMVGCGDNSANAETNSGTKTEDGFDKEIKIPKEAREFVNEYSDRYNDTETAVGAFYSLDSYSADNSCNIEHLNIMISQDDVDSYNEFQMGWWDVTRSYANFDLETMTNDMGFKLFRMSPEDSEESDETAKKSMDNLIGPMTELMVNYLIKNPDDDAKAIIAWEYKKMCSMAGYSVNDYENQRDSEIVESTAQYIERVESIAAQFKGNQHLIYMPTSEGTDARCSGFTPTDKNPNGYDVRSQNIDATMFFKVETFDSNGQVTESVYDFECGISTFIENGNDYLFFGS